MIIKIGNKITDSKDEPIMITLSPEEKALIHGLSSQFKFCLFPKDFDTLYLMGFMEDEQIIGQSTDNSLDSKIPTQLFKFDIRQTFEKVYGNIKEEEK